MTGSRVELPVPLNNKVPSERLTLLERYYLGLLVDDTLRLTPAVSKLAALETQLKQEITAMKQAAAKPVSVIPFTGLKRCENSQRTCLSEQGLFATKPTEKKIRHVSDVFPYSDRESRRGATAFALWNPETDKRVNDWKRFPVTSIRLHLPGEATFKP